MRTAHRQWARRRERVERALEVEPGAAAKLRRRRWHSLFLGPRSVPPRHHESPRVVPILTHVYGLNDAATAWGTAGSIGGLVSGGQGSTTVLVVDDEPAIRLLCRVNLELDGYRVLEARSLGAARAELAAGPVALVLLDMRIGHERGDQLLDELNERGVPVIVVTGSAEFDPGWTSKTSAVLGKPFAIDDLLHHVRTLAPR